MGSLILNVKLCLCSCALSDNIVAELESFMGLIQRVTGHVRIRHSHTLTSLAFLRSLRYIDGEKLLDECVHARTHTLTHTLQLVAAIFRTSTCRKGISSCVISFVERRTV